MLFHKIWKIHVQTNILVGSIERGSTIINFRMGPSINALKAQAWKLHESSKLGLFIWQVVSIYMAINSRVSTREISCETLCQYVVENEMINHSLFECHPSLQTYISLLILSAPYIFSLYSVYSNLDYFFREKHIIMVQEVK